MTDEFQLKLLVKNFFDNYVSTSFRKSSIAFKGSKKI